VFQVGAVLEVPVELVVGEGVEVAQVSFPLLAHHPYLVLDECDLLQQPLQP